MNGCALGATAALAAVTFWSAPASAQLPPLFEFTGQYLPPSDVPDTPGLRAQVASYDVAVNVPVPLGESTFLIPGLAHHTEGISYQQSPPGFIPVRTLRSFDASLLFTQMLSDHWSVSIRPSVGLAGDLERIDSGAWRYGLVAMGTYVFGDDLVIGGGGLVSWSFGEVLPLPLFYLDWRPTKSWRFETSAPSFAALTFALGDRWELGAQADVAGNSYALRGDTVAAPCAAGGECVDHVAYSVIAASGSVRLRTWSSLWLSASIGHTLWRRFEQKDEGGQTVQSGPINLPNEPLFRVGLTWRIPEGDSAE
jgi:hypothetical protein